MSRTTATFEIDLPKTAKVGDEFTITGRARLTLIREDTINVSTIDCEQYCSDETTYKIRVYNVSFKPA